MVPRLRIRGIVYLGFGEQCDNYLVFIVSFCV